MKDFIFARNKFQTSSFGVQLCGRSLKHRRVTILSNQVPETTYLIFLLIFIKICFYDFDPFYVCGFLTYVCFPYWL